MPTKTTTLPANLLTIYGRNPVLEALKDQSVRFFRVHLADSNKPGSTLSAIKKLCRERAIEVIFHDRMSLSRISKNRKQDQGIAADIIPSGFTTLEEFLGTHRDRHFRLLALENVTNPQNLGMIIRSVCAGYLDGLLLPKTGCARIDGLVIKASAGTLFKTPIVFCDQLPDALKQLHQASARVMGLTLTDSRPIHKIPGSSSSVMVLGNETSGLTGQVLACCDERVHIPMNNTVESLNVAVTAGILCFSKTLFSIDRYEKRSC